MSPGTELVPIEGADQALDAVQQRVAQAEAQANALQVTSDAQAGTAGEVLREIARQRKQAEGERKELVGPLNQTVKRINQRFKDGLAPLNVADNIVRGKLGSYQAEQDRIREEEEARLERERQERERKAREEREHQEAVERAKREQAEREAREAAEEAERAKDAADREAAEKLAEEARRTAAEAQTAEAAIQQLPEPSLPKAVVEAPRKPEGVSTRKRWRVASVNPLRLPAEYLLPNEKAINEAMRAGIRADGKPPEIPGVDFEQVSEMAVRGGPA